MILSIYLKLDCKLSGVGLGFSICSSETNYIIKITDVWNVIGHKNLQISKIKLEQLRKSGDDELTQSKISWAVAVNMSHSPYIYSSEALCLLSTICRFLILISESKRLSTEQQQLDYQRRVSRKHLHICFWRLTSHFLYCMVTFEWRSQYTKFLIFNITFSAEITKNNLLFKASKKTS